jgi:hypothetical protein
MLLPLRLSLQQHLLVALLVLRRLHEHVHQVCYLAVDDLQWDLLLAMANCSLVGECGYNPRLILLRLRQLVLQVQLQVQRAAHCTCRCKFYLVKWQHSYLWTSCCMFHVHSSQVRRSTYHEVLKASEAATLLDVTGEGEQQMRHSVAQTQFTVLLGSAITGQ